jgi:hypothetical protein
MDYETLGFTFPDNISLSVRLRQESTIREGNFYIYTDSCTRISSKCLKGQYNFEGP